VLITRFILMRRIDRLPPQLVVMAALASMAIAYAVLAISARRVGTVASAIMLGVGYSVAYPRILVWAVDLYSERERPKTVALVNAIFNVGGLLAPLVGGTAMSFAPFPILSSAVAIAGGCSVAFVLVASGATQRVYPR
jgi:predicted MFS family arabinose efflux permease